MAAVACGVCKRVVYPDCRTLANHTVTIDAGAITWTARDFEMTVHKCRSATPDPLLRALGPWLFHVIGGPVTFYGNTYPPSGRE